jgi:hypothetical protein
MLMTLSRLLLLWTSEFSGVLSGRSGRAGAGPGEGRSVERDGWSGGLMVFVPS